MIFNPNNEKCSRCFGVHFSERNDLLCKVRHEVATWEQQHTAKQRAEYKKPEPAVLTHVELLKMFHEWRDKPNRGRLPKILRPLM